MTTSGWRIHSRRVIADVLIEYEAQCLLLSEEMEPKKRSN